MGGVKIYPHNIAHGLEQKSFISITFSYSKNELYLSMLMLENALPSEKITVKKTERNGDKTKISSFVYKNAKLRGQF